MFTDHQWEWEVLHRMNRIQYLQSNRPPGMGAPTGPKLPPLVVFHPSKQMKKVAVPKIAPLKVSKTVWMDIVSNYLKKVSNQVTMQLLEDDYEIKEKEDKAAAVVEEAPTTPAKQSFMDPKQSYQLSLLLAYLRMTPHEIVDTIVTMNVDKLGKQTVVAMKDLVPTQEVMKEITSFVQQNDVQQLQATDQLFYYLRHVPRLQERLACWATSLSLSNLVVSVAPDLELLLSAVDQVLQSGMLKQFLSVCLVSIANHLFVSWY